PYELALLIALADIAVESCVEDDAESPVLLLAEKFVEHCWQQAVQLPGRAGPMVLRHSTGWQASVVGRIVQAQKQRAATLIELWNWPAAQHWRNAEIAHTVLQNSLFR